MSGASLESLVGGFGIMHANDPLPGFQFSLSVELLYDIPLKAVRNINRQNEYEHIHEGGLNDYVHMRRKPISQPFTFEVERYLMNAITDPLSNGTELTLPVILTVDNIKKECSKIFVFTGVVVMGKRYGDFTADRSELATEIITLGYNNLYVIPNFINM